MKPHEYDLVVELRERRAWSCGRIARALGVPVGHVKWVCLRDGIEDTGQRPPTPIGAMVIATKDGGVMRRFTPAEDARLVQLRCAGMTVTSIARELKRPRSSVTVRLAMLARHEEQAKRFAKRMAMRPPARLLRPASGLVGFRVPADAPVILWEMAREKSGTLATIVCEAMADWCASRGKAWPAS